MKSNTTGTGHGMSEPLNEQVSKRRIAEQNAKREKQTEEFANNSLPTKESVTTCVHESKHFPFQIIDIVTTDNETGHSEQVFKIGVGGAFMSDKVFSTHLNAEKYIGGRPWELITNLMCYTIQNAFEYEKSQSKR